jgi:CPA1 family monovalent cation:H+ antiporter
LPVARYPTGSGETAHAVSFVVPAGSAATVDPLLQALALVIALLLVASLVAMAARRLRIPYTVALVLVGLAIGGNLSLTLTLTPDLILALLVPPLVFEAAFHLSAAELRRVLPTILLLAVPGVIATMLIVGGLVAWLTPTGLAAGLLFGALISATDPVAVVAVFRALGVPRRLAVLLEGESLLNDGTAIVLFQLALAAALTGGFAPLQGLVAFVTVSAGGVLLGLALGWLTARLIARLDDYLIETTLTTVLAYGSYLLAEWLHVSGVLAVVAAGLVAGNLGPRTMSPTTRVVLVNFWDYAAFLANSLVFLLIGLQVHLPSLLAAWQPILVAIVAALVARVLVVYGFGWLPGRLVEPLPPAWQHVLAWGGLRGAIALALVLSLPAELGAARPLLQVMTYGVVLFTLLVQGTTTGLLLRRLGIVAHSQAGLDYELQRARLTMLRAAETHLERLHRQGLLSPHTRNTLRSELERSIAARARIASEALRADPALEAEELERARRELRRAQRSALLDLRHEGTIAEQTFDQLGAEIDAELDATQEQQAEPEAPPLPFSRPPTRPEETSEA